MLGISELRKEVEKGFLMQVAEKMDQLKTEPNEPKSILYFAYHKFKNEKSHTFDRKSIVGLLKAFGAKLTDVEKAGMKNKDLTEI